MSASASTAVFYSPAYWCHSCDMSIGLPPSPTPHALLCPHCHRDSLEQMDIQEQHPIPPPTTFTPSDDNFLLNSPYLHRLIHHLTATNNPRSAPAPKSSIQALEEVAITDPTLLCPVCKDPFVADSVAKLMPCKHTYHPDCIVPWLEINNSCPVCRFKLPPAAAEEGEREGYVGGSMRLEELVDDDEVDLYGFRNTLRQMVRRHRWNDDDGGNVGSEGGNLFSPTQIGEVVERGDGVLERANSVETVSSSWPRWQQVEEREGGGNDDGGDDAFGRRS